MTASRRELLTMGGLGLAALAVSGAASAEQPLGTVESANVRLVRDFITAMAAPGADFAALLDRFLAPDATVRWSDRQPAAQGRDAALAKLVASFPKGATSSIVIDEIFAHGPLVATYRTDAITMPGRPTMTGRVAGVHIVKGGKIVEYADYILA